MADGLNDMDKPNLTEQELWEYLFYDEDLVGVTRRCVKWAVLRREIVPTRIGNRNYFTKNDGLQWITARRQPGVYVAPPSRGRRVK
ncbi:hypothetical protein ABIA30_002950 [Mycobacterium sp. MAA66]|uniref:hypothetical protein n=1 Tax=Mycobacterium sp. MAA66 TaxID=3156297 RepID=UPI003510E9D0